MPINSFSVGRDVALNFNTPAGPRTLSIITGFESRQMTKKNESHGLDGVVRFQYIPGGWEGHFEFDRSNRNFDDLIFDFEQLYLNGQNVPACAITETITETDGSISQWRYEGVMFAMPEHGNWKGDSKVMQRMDWCASFRKKVQ